MTGVNVLPGRRACRCASHQAATKPNRYISPYHRIASEPIRNATGSNCGYSIISPEV